MKSDAELIAELKKAAEGLYWMSESDYPFEAIISSEISHERLTEMAGKPAGALVKEISVDDFFHFAMSEPGWKTEQALATARRYQALLKLLEESLDELKVYKIGEINIPVYILGRAESGNWLGLFTHVVET